MDDKALQVAKARLARLQARMSEIWDAVERMETERSPNWKSFSAMLMRRFEELEVKEAQLLQIVDGGTTTPQ